MDQLTHNDLCLATARWAITPPGAAWLALYEYQSFASQEFPDVLTYSSTGTVVYEIKMSHSDFIADQKKEARVLHGSAQSYSGIMQSVRQITSQSRKKENAIFIDKRFTHKLEKIEPYIHCICRQDKTYQQVPHLGAKRFYVCPTGIISKDEVPIGWGLIYTDDGKKFRQILESAEWKPNVKVERDLIAHALRRFGNGDEHGILIHKW